MWPSRLASPLCRLVWRCGHRDGASTGDQLATHHGCIPDVLHTAADRVDRNLAGFGVEIAADHDACLGIVIEQRVDQHADLERLADTLHRGNEIALSPSGGGAPAIRIELLAGDRAEQQRLEM